MSIESSSTESGESMEYGYMQPSLINQDLETIMLPAYGPCPGFSGACSTMRWSPEEGHVPRGVKGGAGTIEEIELILVFAEPGDPLPGEIHSGFASTLAYTNDYMESGKTVFHKNVMGILESCWPNLTYQDRLRKVWMTESVLCSAPQEGGNISMRVIRECGKRYLLKQLELMPHALVVALGSKARDRLRKLGVVDFLECFAAAPPGCNRPEARKTWARIPEELHRRQCAHHGHGLPPSCASSAASPPGSGSSLD